MKKFLSLVLALVMTMSLVTISAGAKDYADADKITYVEAVDVLSALGVLEGDANGFRPTDTLKRSEAAKIIAALNLTPKTAATLSADAAPFADVAASHWAAGYIAEGVDSGILAGVGGNKFAPDAELTGYAYLKMLLVCLGYDAAIEGMTGANWSVNVAKLAKKAGLTDGNDDFVGSAAVTREEAALYALNTLQAFTVSYDHKGTTVTVNGIEIATGASAAKVSDTEQYMDENYSRLVPDKSDVDMYGRPATTWTYKGEKVGTYAKAPILSYTAATKAKDIKADLKAEGYKNKAVYDKDGNLTGKTEITDTTYDATKNGSLVEFYGEEGVTIAGKDYNLVTKVVTIDTYIAKVTDIKADKKGTSEKDEREIVLENMASVLGLCADDDDVVANFEALYDEVEEDDYLLYTLGVNEDGDQIFGSVTIPETVEGKVTKVADGKVTVSGETYKQSKNCGTIAVAKETQKIWLDSYGYAIRGEKTDNKSDVVYLVKLYTATNDYNETTNYAQVVTTDGEVENIVLVAGQTLTEGWLYTYTTNTDDEATLKTAASDPDVDVAALSAAIDDEDIKIKKVGYFAEDVLFIYIKNTGSKLKVAVEEGVQNVAKGAAVSAVLNDDGDITTVFVKGEPDTDTDADALVFVNDNSDKGDAYDSNDKQYNTYKLYIDGESSIEMVKSAPSAKQFYTYSVNDDGVYTLKTKTTYQIDSIAKDKYILMSEVTDDNGEVANVLLDTDAEIYDLTDNGISSLAELADQWDEAKNDENITAVEAYAAYDSKNEVVLCIYIVD